MKIIDPGIVIIIIITEPQRTNERSSRGPDCCDKIILESASQHNKNKIHY
jgi:hypothetical protein